MASAFQSSAFQNNAFQITAAPSVVLLGGKAYPADYSYQTPYSKFQAEQEALARKRAEAERLAEQIALAEQKRQAMLQQLADAREAKRQKRAIALLEVEQAGLQDEINALRMERVRLMRLIDDEEAILVLLLSLPFH